MAGRSHCGGVGDTNDATDEIKAFCMEVKEEVLKKCELNAFEIYEPIHYKSQIVAGTNYFVKIKIDNTGKCVHVRLFEPLPCYKDQNSNKSVELHSLQKDKSLDDAVVHF